MSYIPFGELKERADILTVAHLLNLNLSKDEKAVNSHRANCPMCKDDRSIVITPTQNAFYCFAAKQGGDQLTLAAHVMGVPINKAAQWIALQLAVEQPKPPKEEPHKAALAPLGHLVYEHAEVQALGLTKEDAERLGIGYAKRGIMRGKVAFPIRLENGRLVGYVGWSKEGIQLPPEWRLP